MGRKSSKYSRDFNEPVKPDREFDTARQVYDGRLKRAKTGLKEKYNKFFETPQSHKQFAYHWEQFGKNSELKSAKKEPWRNYWGRQMEKEFDKELEDAKERILQEVFGYKDQQQQEKKTSDTKLYDQKPPTTKDTTEKNPEPAAGNMPVPKVDEIKQDDRKVIVSNSVRQLLKNYEAKVCEMILNVNETFKGYAEDSKTYPNINMERKDCLTQEVAAGTSPEELILHFDEKFAEYWKKRVKSLRDDEVEVEKEKIQENWQDLLVAPLVLDTKTTFEAQKSADDAGQLPGQ